MLHRWFLPRWLLKLQSSHLPFGWQKSGLVKEGHALFLLEPILEVSQDSSAYTPLAEVASVRLRSVVFTLDGPAPS